MDFVLEHADFTRFFMPAGQIHKRVTHNDTKLNNLLFNAQDQAICGRFRYFDAGYIITIILIV